jgi:hypothetical protein
VPEIGIRPGCSHCTIHVPPVPPSVPSKARPHPERHNLLFRLNLLQRLVRHGDIRLVGLMLLSRFSPRLSVVIFTRHRWFFGSAVYVGAASLTCN